MELGVSTEGTGLDVSVSLDAGSLVVVLAGCAEMTVVEPLRVIVENLHAKAVAAHLREVRVDLAELEFMSSSCFKCLVSWITSIRDLEPDAQYRLLLRSGTTHLWQRRSLHVLQTFATELVTIES